MANTGTRKRRSPSTKQPVKKPKARRARTPQEIKMMFEISFIVSLAICVLLFLCNFGIIGIAGDAVSKLLFGLLGVLQYIFPLYLIFIFLVGWKTLSHTKSKVVSLTLLMFFLGNIFDLINGVSKNLETYSVKEIYLCGALDRRGGGLISGSFTYALSKLLGVWGTVIVSVIAIIICLIIATEDTLFSKIKESGNLIAERNSENKKYRQEYILEQQAAKAKRDEERLRKQQERRELQDKKEQLRQNKEDEKILRVNQKVSGVTENTLLTPKSSLNPDIKKVNNDIHEITVNDFDYNDSEEELIFIEEDPIVNVSSYTNEHVVKTPSINKDSERSAIKVNNTTANTPAYTANTDHTQDIKIQKNGNIAQSDVEQNRVITEKPVTQAPAKAPVPIETKHPEGHFKYQFPPIDLLTLNTNKSGGDSEESVRETANKLIDTLAIFGVKASVDNICQGPSVTRFEIIPELGTKVSRIKGLSDDIKLNLATSDIRIEAPIPGKAAVGIELPNKINQAVLLRDLIDTPEFKKSGSSLTFAVGKDISGSVIVYDIDQFPHLLIAGATGSGKSVCINTLILSIIYKAHPDDVKMIMIDPKVVELSVYNGIPHLLIPVVTDAKKASAALNWAVTEMMERYKKFADLNVRDLKGYNKAVLDREKTEGPSEIYKKLPQIVIIVDELADLMMVAKGDVEDAICRLAQLARACGIHLIIATQRPSVDVITGLIKANMPSRIAFAVSSNIDSRTILDMGGAEELLGKGDMLFFPKGLKKPVRLQGAFVSDPDVNKIVDFLKPQSAELDDNSAATIQYAIENAPSAKSAGSGGSSDQGSGSDEDDLLIDAAKFIIENDKASIGNLQKKFRIGFNRAARIMDRLAELGVVSEDEGTKARRVLMSMESLENLMEQGEI